MSKHIGDQIKAVNNLQKPNIKTTINNEWSTYIKRQIDKGVNKTKLEAILRKQNYSDYIINSLLYPKNISHDGISVDSYLNDNEKTIYYEDPKIYTYSNFLSDEECEYFINISKNKLTRALVSSENNGIKSNGRTGTNTWIKHDYSEITKNVGEKIAKIVGIPLKHAEAFQIIHYDKTQEYRDHYDSWDHNKSEKTLRCMKYGGARLITALCYLNTVEKGGGTKFTKLGITISANKGKLLVFQNTISEKNHDKHLLSEHAGTPVEEGEKYAFNLWFRECDIDTLYKDFNPNYYE